MQQQVRSGLIDTTMRWIVELVDTDSRQLLTLGNNCHFGAPHNPPLYESPKSLRLEHHVGPSCSACQAWHLALVPVWENRGPAKSLYLSYQKTRRSAVT